MTSIETEVKWPAALLVWADLPQTFASIGSQALDLNATARELFVVLVKLKFLLVC